MELSEEILVKDDHYDESDIQVLEGLEAVRKRPGMYIGTTSSAGLHHLVWEIVDNGIDEALAGFATCIQVIVDENNIVTVKDDGRGVPTGVHEKTGKSTVETIYTVLHAGGKFGGGAYKVSGGLHGVGASVVNALSEFLEVEIERDGNKYFQRFENGGTPVGDLQIIGTSDKHGTTVRFKADPEIFTETTVYNHGTLKHRLQELAFLNKGIKIIFDDLRENETPHEEFFYEGGIQEYVRYLTEEKEVILENPLYMEGKRTVEVNHTDMDIMVEISIQYTRDFDTKKPLSFCNNINTAEGGSHIDGFNNALNNALNEYFRNQYLKNAKSKETEESLTGDDIREGMVAIVSVKHPDPQYEGQTKSKLGSSEVRNVVYRVMKENLDRFLMENPNSAREIIEKAMLARNGRIAAKKAKELVKRKGLLDEGFSTLLGKLADCTSRNPEECEIYIVEGDSAGGSAKEGRDRKTQAILPLRGKILNVQKANINRIYDNNEIKTMVTAFGCGVGDNIDLDKLRYHKVVIMTDADVDGAHIRILLLTFFFKFLRPMVEEGYVYFAQPPLYKIEKNKNVKYAYSDDEMERVRKEMGTGCSLQRYKGLGEMNKDQLWETTMNPENRTLVKVNVDDAEQACEIFEMLMGDEVDPRKNFIMENAQFVKNLDI